MSDIFLSYVREDRPVAKRLTDVLTAEGFTVFWDRLILGSQEFEKVLERELGQTTCVVTLWSRASAESRWVRAEAEEGARRGVLVSLRIEDVPLPLAFRQIQSIDLIGWDGRADHDGVRDLMKAIAFLSGESRAQKEVDPLDSGHQGGRSIWWQPKWVMRGVVITAIVAITGVVVLVGLLPKSPEPAAATAGAGGNAPNGPNGTADLSAARSALDQLSPAEWGTLSAVELISRVTQAAPFIVIEALADQDDDRALTLLALAAESGLNGVERDPSRAAALLRKAASKDNSTALANLGYYFDQGIGVKRDEYEAARLFRQSAQRGNAWGQANLGVYLRDGKGGEEKDDPEAARLFRLAADQGNAIGRRGLAHMMETGSGGLKRDDVEAARLYQLAAEQGDSYAQLRLGVFSRDARGGLRQNDVEAVRLFRLASAGGQSAASTCLGYMVENGRGGLSKDPQEAVRLYREAARLGDEEARNLLQKRNEKW